MCPTASFLATGVFFKLFHKFHDFSMIIQVLSNYMIFHDYPSFIKFHDFSIHGTVLSDMISRACGNPVKNLSHTW